MHPCSVIEHENIYVFAEKQGTYNPQKTEGKPYKMKRKEGETPQYHKNNIPTESEYDGTRHPTSVIEHENIYVFAEKQGTYNPQKTEGKPYTIGARAGRTMGYYGDHGDKYVNTGERVYDGARHPTSILEYQSVHKTIHRTEKPVGILEYLIKSYSNEGDTVMDFTMGSGSCGEACFNTKRRFIGVEKDDNIFVLAQERLSNLDSD